ncbi:MAG: hypothetical protein GY860_04530 [Desulfobacteraceae bacterium]|nr:hypothetical protein [Desulfobacteraceae bacterium]
MVLPCSGCRNLLMLVKEI